MANVKIVGIMSLTKGEGGRERGGEGRREGGENPYNPYKRARNRFCVFSELLQTYPQETLRLLP